MTTVKNIFDYLNLLFPVDTALSFDNVGLLVGDENSEITKCLIALDCTHSVVKKATDEGCELIITHHPVIFTPLKSLTSGDLQFELVKNGISVISMHTNLDMAYGGVNDCLCKALELKNVSAVTAEDGFILKSGELSPLSADNLAVYIKNKLNCRVTYVDGRKPIKKVLVCSGSGGEFVTDAINGKFDALITSEIKHHQYLTAHACGISVFDAGHFNTENVVVEPLKNILSDKFTDIMFLTDRTTCIKQV